MVEKYTIISCGKNKLNRDAEAREMYTGPFFSKMREYAETCAERYWILSSKYGLIEPDKIIEPYDKTPNDITDEKRKEIQGEALDRLRSSGVDWEGDEAELIVLGGKDYKEILEPVTDELPADVRYPLQSERFAGLGDQMSWLKNRIESQRMEGQRTLGEDP